jgi:hypothetical protein
MLPLVVKKRRVRQQSVTEGVDALFKLPSMSSRRQWRLSATEYITLGFRKGSVRIANEGMIYSLTIRVQVP